MVKLFKFIYHKILRPRRIKKEIENISKLDFDSILEIGYFDDMIKNLLPKEISYFAIDPAPMLRIVGCPLNSIEDFYTKKKFDLVLCSSILEHTTDPVLVIKKIKNLASKYVVISVPYEPFYTLSRFFIPEKEHTFTIHPNILKFYFGHPIFEEFQHLRRNYFAIYDVKNFTKEDNSKFWSEK
jgi:SAM-dependent methyltransferase